MTSFSSAPALISVDSLTRTFGSGSNPIRALDGVTLDIAEGEFVAIIGSSGSGKSTLMNILGCLDRPTAGTYRFLGIDVGTLSEKRRAGLRGRGIGFVFQSFHLLQHRSVIENVMLAEVYRHGSRRNRRERAAAVLQQVGLAHRIEQLPTTLSGGERQRVAVARALLNRPPLLLCDEPTGNLDSATTASVLGLIREINEAGQTVVMITHDDDVAAEAERVVRMTDGKLNPA